MTIYQRILAHVILGAVLVDLINGSLIVFGFVKPPLAQAIILTVMAAFTLSGLIALALLLLSLGKKNKS
jgi:hypothetical protein